MARDQFNDYLFEQGIENIIVVETGIDPLSSDFLAKKIRDTDLIVTYINLSSRERTYIDLLNPTVPIHHITDLFEQHKTLEKVHEFILTELEHRK